MKILLSLLLLIPASLFAQPVFTFKDGVYMQQPAGAASAPCATSNLWTVPITQNQPNPTGNAASINLNDWFCQKIRNISASSVRIRSFQWYTQWHDSTLCAAQGLIRDNFNIAAGSTLGTSQTITTNSSNPNPWQTYVFTPAITIPANTDFYIGIQNIGVNVKLDAIFNFQITGQLYQGQSYYCYNNSVAIGDQYDAGFYINTCEEGTYQDSPSNYAGLTGWWKADDTGFAALTDGTAIGNASTTTWTNRGVGMGDLTQATSGSRPTIKLNIIGTKPVIRFDGVDDSLNCVGAGNYGDFTMIAVCSVTNDAMLWGYTVSNNQMRRNQSLGNTLSTYFLSTANAHLSDAFGRAATNLTVASIRRSGSTLYYRENMTARNTAPETGQFVFNEMGATSYGQNMAGDYAESCMYSNFLSDSQLDSLYTNYFKFRWVTLP